MSSHKDQSLRGFRAFSLNAELSRNLHAAGYSEPRPIQRQTIPAVLAGRDVLGLAQTGTGKTAAFALPILQNILAEPDRRGPRVLVVAPTRELALQIEGEFVKLAHSTGIRTAVVFGGVPAGAQIRKLRRRPEIIVACPGRLLDLHQRGAVRLEQVETLVLDEADHMFDMGFLPDIRRIISLLPGKRQNLLFGATMPREIRRLAEQILHDPHVSELAHSAPARTIDHSLIPVREHEKQALLEHILSGADFRSAIVFARTKHRARRLAKKLCRAGHNAVDLQGNMSQPQRDRAMGGFRNGRYDILVATDIAARGIDVEQVSHVINFDLPNTPEAYTHRIGRTGRSERTGRAYTFVADTDRKGVRGIEKTLGHRIRIGALEGFTATGTRGGQRPHRQPRTRRPAAKRERAPVLVTTARKDSFDAEAFGEGLV